MVGSSLEESGIKVSVIFPVCNAMPYLVQAMDTIRNQTLKEIEIICVDDGSTDGSYEKMQEYASKDERIRILKSGEENKGAAIARNIGIKEARGKYLSILDADDFFDLDMLEKTYKCAESFGAEIIIYDGWNFDNEIGVDYYQKNFNILWTLFYDNLDVCPLYLEKVNGNIFAVTHGAAWNELYLRSFVEENDLRFVGDYFPDDMVFVYTALALANNVQIMKNRFVHYRKSNSNQTSSANKKLKIVYNGPYLITHEFQKRNLYELYKTHILKFTLEYMRYWLGLMDDAEKFHDAFYLLKDKYFEELGVLDLSDEEEIDVSLLSFRDAICNHTAEEYLFYREKEKEKKEDEKDRKALKVLKILSGCQKIALYGAGIFGRQIHEAVCSKHPYLSHIEISAWVDKNYQDIGYPVQSPDTIKDICCDHVVVAVKKETLYQEIKSFLINMDISEENIIHVIRVYN